MRLPFFIFLYHFPKDIHSTTATYTTYINSTQEHSYRFIPSIHPSSFAPYHRAIHIHIYTDHLVGSTPSNFPQCNIVHHPPHRFNSSKMSFKKFSYISVGVLVYPTFYHFHFQSIRVGRAKSIVNKEYLCYHVALAYYIVRYIFFMYMSMKICLVFHVNECT